MSGTSRWKGFKGKGVRTGKVPQIADGKCVELGLSGAPGGKSTLLKHIRKKMKRVEKNAKKLCQDVFPRSVDWVFLDLINAGEKTQKK